MRPGRVGVLTTSFPRWPGDFAGGFVEDAVRRLALTGVEIDVVAAGDAAAPSSTVLLLPGVRVHRIPLSRPPAGMPILFYSSGAPEVLEHGGPGAWLQAAELWAGMCRAVSVLAPAWARIEAHWLVPCGLAARASAPHLPLSIRVHSGDVALLERLPGGRALARYLVKPAAAGPPALGFVTRDLKERFARLAETEVGSVIPASVSPQARGVEEADPGLRASSSRGGKPTHPSLGRALAPRTLLSVGRLVPIKGYDVLVRAVAIAIASSDVGSTSVRSAPRPTLVILGDGPERQRLAALARRLDVDLRLPGFVSRDQVATWLRSADLYVQPSRRLPTGRTEGLPTATLEALSAGVPVVASETGGLGELPSDPPRFRLVPPDDPVALAACLEL